MKMKSHLTFIGLAALALTLSIPSLGSSCWPCEGDCGSTTGWHVIGRGRCSDWLVKQCENNECTSYDPNHDTCSVACWWETWADPTEQEECTDVYQVLVVCAQ